MSEQWWRLTVRCQPADADAVAELLVRVSGQGIEEPEAGELRSVAESEMGARHLLEQAQQDFENVTGEISPIESIDWTTHWRDGILTRRFGRLVVSPSWLPPTLAENEVLVTLDPESAFGNGEHGSTRVAMALLEKHLKPGQRVLDFGSGSGILAIAAVKLGAASAIGIEVDGEAIPISNANAELNDVAKRVGFLVGDAEDLGPLAGPADLICSNILRSVNTMLLPALMRSLSPKGVVIFSGMEELEAELFRPVLESKGWRIIDEARDAGWWGVAAHIA